MSDPTSSKPVMYLDVDDTLIRWSPDFDAAGVGAEGAAEFLSWAAQTFEVRWLTYWCPSGILSYDRAQELAAILCVESAHLQRIRGLDWSAGPNKLAGIDWEEHDAGRPWVWVEDENCILDFENTYPMLVARGVEDRWRPCNVTADPAALRNLHFQLSREFGAGGV